MYSHNQHNKYKNIVSRSVGECNTTIYCSDINWAIVVRRTETIREDGTIIRTVGKARPWSTYQYTDAGRPEPQ